MQPGSHSPVNIVIIEPSAADRYWLRMTLENCELPHSVTEFSSALNALEAFSGRSPGQVDFVFITVCPPLLEISEAVERLAGIPAFRAACFGVTILDRRELALVPAGCRPFMKPLEVEEVCSFVGARPRG